jgi:hypothetical protein
MTAFFGVPITSVPGGLVVSKLGDAPGRSGGGGGKAALFVLPIRSWKAASLKAPCTGRGYHRKEMLPRHRLMKLS